MTWSHLARVSGVVAIVISIAFVAFFGGNQRLAYAGIRDGGAVRTETRSSINNLNGLATEIICHVFTQLNEYGDPIPYLSIDSFCPRQPQCSDGIDNDNDGRIDAADASCHVDFVATNPASYRPNIDAEDLEPTGQCADGIDNDGDGKIDFPSDPGCESPHDSDEADPVSAPQCSDGIDNDGDGKIDSDDPGCSSDDDNDETDPTDGGGGGAPQCSDGLDNDEDGFTDENDPNCHSDLDPTNDDSYTPEGDESGDLPACWNGLDDDEDGKIDLNDPGCSAPNDDDETDPVEAPQCSDGIDNDGDGKIDSEDPGCTGAGDDDETDPTPAPQCSDGTDNDGDGKIDGDDPGCSNDDDNDETDPSNSGGSSGSTPSSGGGGGGGTIVGLIGSVVGGLGGAGTGTTIPEFVGVASCDAYLTEFIKFGGQNNEMQVRRLQRVLKDFEGMDVDVSGLYDARTHRAVHAFQQKYASDILQPWGINQSTGYVYLTTRKKVNEIYCNNTKQFPLTSEQRAEIERVKTSIQSGATVIGTPVQDTPSENAQDTQIIPAIIPSFPQINLGDLGSSKDTASQTASAAESVDEGSSSSLRGLFKRIINSVWNRVSP